MAFIETKKDLPNRKECLKCGKSRTLKEFYMSDSDNHKDRKYPVCKACIKSELNIENPHSQEAIESMKDVLLDMNRPFIYSVWLSSVEESAKTNKEKFGLYIKNVIQNHRSLSWKDSEFTLVTSTPQTIENQSSELNKGRNESEIQLDDRNKEDVLRMLGYDPFEYENESDKRHLCNKLVDFLDESTLEDSFKLPAVIEIVKSFNQLDKINNAISLIMSDPSNITNVVGGIKSLIDSKQKMLKSVLDLAKDNGISVNHNNNKSKGGGTLSGIIKTLQEKGFEQGEVNLFDIETAAGMKQVADLSNHSIIAQLQFDENNYTEMIIEQREIIQKLDSDYSRVEEENRLLKKEIMQYRTRNSGDDDE